MQRYARGKIKKINSIVPATRSALQKDKNRGASCNASVSSNNNALWRPDVLASWRLGVLHNREAGASAPDDGWNGPQAGSGGPTADAIASESGRTGRRDARTPGHQDTGTRPRGTPYPVPRITKSEGPRLCIQGPGGKIKKPYPPSAQRESRSDALAGVRRSRRRFFAPCGAKKSRRRPTLARASPALPSAMEPLTSVFGMGTGVTTPLWPPAKSRSVGNLRDLQPTTRCEGSISHHVKF